MSVRFSGCLSGFQAVCQVLGVSVGFSGCLSGSRAVCRVLGLSLRFSGCLSGSRLSGGLVKGFLVPSGDRGANQWLVDSVPSIHVERSGI